MNLYDVIDTAVKIGLGAIISGVSAYKLAKLNTEAELKKTAWIEKRKVFEEAIDEGEKAFNRWRRFHSLARGIIHQAEERGEKISNFNAMNTPELQKRNGAFMDSSEAFYHHIARLTLHEAITAAAALRTVYDRMHEVREPMVIHNKIPSYKELAGAKKSIEEAVSVFHDEISKAYANLKPSA